MFFGISDHRRLLMSVHWGISCKCSYWQICQRWRILSFRLETIAVTLILCLWPMEGSLFIELWGILGFAVPRQIVEGSMNFMISAETRCHRKGLHLWRPNPLCRYESELNDTWEVLWRHSTIFTYMKDLYNRLSFRKLEVNVESF